MFKHGKSMLLYFSMILFGSCSLNPQAENSNVQHYEENVLYSKGSYVLDNGQVYVALTAVKDAQPSKFTAEPRTPRHPWRRSSEKEAMEVRQSGQQPSVPEWTKDGVYLADQPVKRNEGYYKAFWWTQGNDPSLPENKNNHTVNGETYWGPWLEITKAQAEDLASQDGNGGSTEVNPDNGSGNGSNTGSGNGGTPPPPATITPELVEKHSWNPTAVYLENNVAVYEGYYIRAKWWTQGNEPVLNPKDSWDTPWEIISEEVFLSLLAGTPPPTTIPPIVNPPVVNPPTGGGNEIITPPSADYEFLYKNGYLKEWDWNDSDLPENLKEHINKIKTRSSSSSAESFFTGKVNAAQWEQLFPRRRGTAAWAAESGLSSADYYSYENFRAALRLLGQYVYFIEVALDPSTSAETFFERNYVLNRKTGKLRLIKQNEDYFSSDAGWLLNRPYKVKVVDYNAFGTEGSDNDKIRAIAGFLAHASHETSGSWATAPGFAFNQSLFPGQLPSYVGNTLPGELAWSLYFNEEVAFSGATSSHYEDPYNKIFPPTRGQSYHGRGAFQLSWNYNYGLASAIFFGTSKVLLDNPNMILNGGTAPSTWISSRIEGGTLAFLTSLMFWLTPQGTKPSQQDTMILNRNDGRYVEGVAKLKKAPGLGSPGFGWTINIMNGGYEANKSWEPGKPNYDSKVARRVKHYLFFTQAFGGNNDSEILDTYGNHSY
ncbi:MAG: glycoside hydrolase family 19 protein [Brevinemataceae bacterium]